MNIRSKSVCGVLTIFILFSFGCKRISQMPKEVPANLEMRFDNKLLGTRHRDGFVSGLGFVRSAVISGNQMSVMRSGCEKEGEKKLTLTNDEINEIYQYFVKSEFDLIENRRLPADAEDGDFREIHFRSDDTVKSVKYSERFPLTEKHRERFNNIWTDIDNFAFARLPSCGK